MKKLLISAGALAALALSNPAQAATSNTATANATVNIVSPLSVTKNSDLDFGTIVANSGAFAGEVVHLDTGGVVACPATLTCSGATVSAASFTVTGTPSQNIVLTLPAAVTLNGSGGGTLNVDLSGDEPATAEALDAAGSYSFNIGGKLTIPAGTVDGVYQNTFDVTANYQ